MDFADLDDAIATVAHRCWCKRMLEDGWRAAKLFNANKKEHDCLRPYRELTPPKQAQIRRVARWEELASQLARGIHHAMMAYEFSAQDLFIGMRVRLIGDDSGDVGRVVGWEVSDEDPDTLDLIRVHWPNREVTEYAPNEDEIAPVEDDWDGTGESRGG